MYKRKVFTLNDLKPLSINSATINSRQGRGRHKSEVARQFELQVFQKLDTPENKQAFKELRETFVPKLHQFEIDFIAEYPRTDFIAKTTGCISGHTVDQTNWEKIIADLFFLPKHAENEAPYGCQNLMLDDKYLVYYTSRKKISSDGKYRIILQIKIMPRDF